MNGNAIEQRRHPRHEIPLQAFLHAVGVVVPCRVHNISASGVLIETNAQLRIGDHVTLKIADFGTMVGLVARVSSTTVAIAFGDGAEAMDEFIVAWLVLESAGAGRSETGPAGETDHKSAINPQRI